MKHPCPASISGMCLSMVEGFEPCSIDDDICDYDDFRMGNIDDSSE